MEDGIKRVQQYQQSSGVYGGSPFLYPLYGVSEISQGYSRLGAVNGTIFILKRSVQSIVVDNESGKTLGVICSAGQFLEAPVVVTSAKYFPEATACSVASRFVAITDKSLIAEHQLIQMVVPPSSSHATTFITQLDSTTMACPNGKCLPF